MDYSNIEDRMEKAVGAYERNLSEIRAGRANPAILNKVQVEYYGVMSPINQVATISVPEARQILVTPWDRSMVSACEKAINMAELGLNPINDGNSLRLMLPELNEERRKQLVKQTKNLGEEAKVAIRNIRRDSIDEYKKMQKNSEITEDDLKSNEEDIQKITDKYTAIVDKRLEDKEKEISNTKADINTQITLIDRDKEKINSKTSEYTTLTTNLQNASDAANTKNAYKNVITTFLSEIMYVIPKEVVLTSIENPSARKIVINAQSEKYEQLAYFKALLKSKGVLTPSSVVSSEATKEGNIVKIVIEGELP